MKVIIAAGGTGGHLFPGLALAREFIRQMPGSEVIFVGTMQGLEAKVVAREGFELVTIKAQGVMGKGAGGALRGLGLLPVGTAQCIALCRVRRPDLVLGIGGYTSPPLIVAAGLLGIRRVLLEPNAYPGMANRAMAPLANRVFVTFEETVPFFGKKKTRLVGTPIRSEFVEISRLDAERVGTEATSAEPLPVRTSKGPTLLVFGGSQGARSINRAMLEALPALLSACPGLHIIHQTGEREVHEVEEAYRRVWPSDRPASEVTSFLYDMPRAFRQADLIISRSGATTVAELTACGKPAILIPFPHAIYGHQERNARVLQRAGAAHMILDGALTGAVLAEAVGAMLADPAGLAEMGRRSGAMGRTDSAVQVVTECRQLVGL